jgi:hypothetical protein
MMEGNIWVGQEVWATVHNEGIPNDSYSTIVDWYIFAREDTSATILEVDSEPIGGVGTNYDYNLARLGVEKEIKY